MHARPYTQTERIGLHAFNIPIYDRVERAKDILPPALYKVRCIPGPTASAPPAFPPAVPPSSPRGASDPPPVL
jgi:hypothetical protein